MRARAVVWSFSPAVLLLLPWSGSLLFLLNLLRRAFLNFRYRICFHHFQNCVAAGQNKRLKVWTCHSTDEGRTSTHHFASGITASGMVIPGGTSGSSVCSRGFVGNCMSGGGGEPPPAGLGLRLGEREALLFLSRLTGDLRRGDGDLVLRLWEQHVNRVFNLFNTHREISPWKVF